MSAAPPPPAASRWVEPTLLLPLRWGRYRDRWMLGLLLIAGGLLHLQSADTGNLVPLITGSAAHVAGWLVMPAAGWRRIVPLAPSTLVVWLVLTGPASMWTLAVPFLCWLLVRHRSALAALTAVPVAMVALLVGDAFGQDYTRMLTALGIVGVAMLAAGWLAQLIDRRRRR